MFLPGPIGPVTVPGQIVVAIITARIVKEIGPGAETMAVDHPSGGLGVGRSVNVVCRHEISRFCCVLACVLPGSGWASGL